MRPNSKKALEVGLGSPSVFTSTRCRIVLAALDGKSAGQIGVPRIQWRLFRLHL